MYQTCRYKHKVFPVPRHVDRPPTPRPYLKCSMSGLDGRAWVPWCATQVSYLAVGIVGTLRSRAHKAVLNAVAPLRPECKPMSPPPTLQPMLSGGCLQYIGHREGCKAASLVSSLLNLPPFGFSAIVSWLYRASTGTPYRCCIGAWYRVRIEYVSSMYRLLPTIQYRRIVPTAPRTYIEQVSSRYRTNNVK